MREMKIIYLCSAEPRKKIVRNFHGFYSLRGIRDPHGDPLSIPGLSRVLSLREAAKRARYRPALGDLVDDPQHLAIFLVEATGRLSDPAMNLVKFIVKDSPSRAILNTFCSQIGGSVHCTLQCYGRPCMGSELHLLLPHLGGGGCGLVLPLHVP